MNLRSKDGERVVPDRLAHVVLRTSRLEPMVTWWATVLNADVAFQNAFICFLSFDDEHHRVAIVQPPDLDAAAGKAAGLDHIAFTYRGLAGLVATYERLAAEGIRPHWAVNHGLTLSLYYRDPDGNQAELQIDRFATSEEGTAFLMSTAFANHPVGHSVDFGDLARRFRAGEDETALVAYKYDHENALRPFGRFSRRRASTAPSGGA